MIAISLALFLVLCAFQAFHTLFMNDRGRSATKLYVSRLAKGSWVPYHGRLRSNERVLVLTHGLWEDIGTAFPPKVATKIQKAGRYDDVLGVTYDWSQPVASDAGSYRAFLQSLPTRHFDIEAHSYGSMKTIAALVPSNATPQNVILLGSPLEGTLMAAETPLTRMIERLPPQLWNGNVGRLQRMHFNGAQRDMLPHSSMLRTLIPAFTKYVKQRHINLILVAADATYGRGSLTNWYLYANGYAPSLFSEPNDGIVSVHSALAEDAVGRPLIPARRGVFRLTHPQLKRAPNAMLFIAEHLKQ